MGAGEAQTNKQTGLICQNTAAQQQQQQQHKACDRSTSPSCAVLCWAKQDLGKNRGRPFKTVHVM
jgi:hypothetical protein